MHVAAGTLQRATGTSATYWRAFVDQLRRRTVARTCGAIPGVRTREARLSVALGAARPAARTVCASSGRARAANWRASGNWCLNLYYSACGLARAGRTQHAGVAADAGEARHAAKQGPPAGSQPGRGGARWRRALRAAGHGCAVRPATCGKPACGRQLAAEPHPLRAGHAPHACAAADAGETGHAADHGGAVNLVQKILMIVGQHQTIALFRGFPRVPGGATTFRLSI